MLDAFAILVTEAHLATSRNALPEVILLMDMVMRLAVTALDEESAITLKVLALASLDFSEPDASTRQLLCNVCVLVMYKYLIK